MKLIIKGTVEFEPFGLSFLKHNEAIDKTLDLGTINKGVNLALPGFVAVYVAAEEKGDALDVEIKVSVYSLAIFDVTEPLVSHIGASHDINVGGEQLGFKGTVSITD